MTFSRAKPPGWTDNIESVNSTQLGTIDTNQSKAVDGAAGGTYAPAATIAINGAGLSSDNLGDTTLQGTLQRTASARWPDRVATGTIVDAVGAQLVDVGYDLHYTTIANASNVVVRLAVSTGQVPITGDIIQVVRDNTSSGSATGSFKIESEDNPGSYIASFPTSVTLQNAALYSAKFWFDGITWKRLRFSADVAPV